MTTELTNLPCGTVQIKCCEDSHLAVRAGCQLTHLVEPKEAQLKQSIRNALRRHTQHDLHR